MRLIALVSAYDEQPAWLAELVASLARAGCGHIVFCDGAYALYPQAKGNSGSTASHVVTAAALGAGMGVTVHQPATPWIGNEVEKRSAMFALGNLIAGSEDWFVVADGDEVWTQPQDLRAALERTELDVAEVILAEGPSHTPIRKCFRAQQITVEGHHARYVAGDGRVLWDAARPTLQVEAEQLWDVRVCHRPAERAALRNADRNAYYARRAEFGAEVAA